MIYGLRLYPQSVRVVSGACAPIFVHGRVSQGCSDFYYCFRPLAEVWRGHVFVRDFGITIGEDGKVEDPVPGLQAGFGSSFVAADLNSQLVILRGDGFDDWGAGMYFCEGAFLPVFQRVPSFRLLKRLFWGRKFRLSFETWPRQMRSVLHMWDDIYWQLFTTEYSDVETLIRSHEGDPRLKMYIVDIDREYPDPSNEELRPATLGEPNR